MTRCGHFDSCIAFFKEQAKNFPATLHFLEETYCDMSNHHCARFMVYTALGGDKVPLDLFPCQQVRGMVITRRAA